MADLEKIDAYITGDWSYRQGTIKVPAPTDEEHAATRLYVDQNSLQGFWEIPIILWIPGDYVIGDEVEDSNKIYICNTAGPQTGTFDDNILLWDLFGPALDNNLQMKTGRNLEMQDLKIINLLDPTSAQDAATKAYVDAGGGAGAVSSVFGRDGVVIAETNDYTWNQIDLTISDLDDLTTKSHTSLTDIGTNTHAQLDSHIIAGNPHLNSAALTGATFTGSVILDDNSGASPNVTWINGVNRECSISCQTTSGDMILDTTIGNLELNPAGDIDAKTNQIKNIVDPTANQDAATKKYVDDNDTPSPLTTKGDVYTFSTVNARLGIGDNGQVLSANSSETTGLEWIDAPTTTLPTQLVSVSPAALNPNSESISFTKTHEKLTNNETINTIYYANIHLPHGETLKSAIAYGSSSSDYWSLFKVSLDGAGTTVEIADNLMNVEDTVIAHTVDNDNYSYILSIRLAQNTSFNGFKAEFT